jgi:AcrR family transcriptional regulator
MSNRQDKASAIGPEQWLAAARALLVAQGIEAVKVDRIARRLGVTRGGFYWHFRGRQALLDALLAEWEETSIIPFAELDSAAPDLESRILTLFLFWLQSKAFDARYDAAIRDWARKSLRVRRAVHKADQRRVAFIAEMFRAAGYPAREAGVRARVLYYTQIGYYALDVDEPVEARIPLAAPYYEIFTGRKLSPGALRAHTAFGRAIAAARRRRRAAPPPRHDGAPCVWNHRRLFRRRHRPGLRPFQSLEPGQRIPSRLGAGDRRAGAGAARSRVSVSSRRPISPG